MFPSITRRINYDFLLLWSLLVVSIGCDDDRRTSSLSRRIDNRVFDGVVTKKPPRTVAKSRIQEGSTSRSTSNPIGEPRPIPEKPPFVPPTELREQQKAATEEERDLESELRSLVGNPMDCLSQQAGVEAPDTIELALEAYVTTNGVVSRSSVRSPDLSNIELTCVKKRIENARFKAPIDDAPRAVRTSVTLRRVNPPGAKQR